MMAVPGASCSSVVFTVSGAFLRCLVRRFGAPPEPMTSGNRIS